MDDKKDRDEMILNDFNFIRQNLQSENDLRRIKLFAFDTDELLQSSSNYNININKPCIILFDNTTDYILFGWIQKYKPNFVIDCQGCICNMQVVIIKN